MAGLDWAMFFLFVVVLCVWTSLSAEMSRHEGKPIDYKVTCIGIVAITVIACLLIWF